MNKCQIFVHYVGDPKMEKIVYNALNKGVDICAKHSVNRSCVKCPFVKTGPGICFLFDKSKEVYGKKMLEELSKFLAKEINDVKKNR